MDSNIFGIYISYDNDKAVFSYKKGTSLKTFLKRVKKAFKIPQLEVQLIDIEWDARILAAAILNPLKKYRIQVVADADDENLNTRNINLNAALPLNIAESNEHTIINPGEIDIQILAGEKFSNRILTREIKQWAGERRFKLKVSEGKKKLKKGFKRTFVCPIKNCKFKMVFKADLEDEEYVIDTKLSQKYHFHSKSFSNLLFTNFIRS